MKVILLFVFITCVNAYCQQLFVEEFNYTAGQNLGIPWTITGTPPYVIDGNLAYDNYCSDVNSNRIFLNQNSINVSISAGFTAITNNVYCSFLINVNSNENLTASPGSNNNLFFSFANKTLSKGFLFIRKSSDSTFNIGIGNKDISTPAYTTNELQIGVTYLIVAGYSINTGTETFRLWINPDLSGAEPAPALILQMTSTLGSVSRIQFYQKLYTGHMYIDAVHTAGSWAEAPLPVELVSFMAEERNNVVELTWVTKSEVNNYGFEVEKSYDKLVWEAIAFVNGAGNSNSEKYYSAVDDKSEIKGSVYYRLKQIDNDGSCTYSEVAEVKIDPRGYELYQNYPNPFNPETVIKWKQESGGIVKIKIYDSAGKVVRTVSEFRNAGLQEIIFSAKGLSSGVYYYELETGNFKSRKMMMVLK